VGGVDERDHPGGAVHKRFLGRFLGTIPWDDSRDLLE
jgi:hypothetical protein